MNVECHLCSFTERIVEVLLGSLRLLFHKRFLAALLEMNRFKRTYFHQRALLHLQRCGQGHGAVQAASRAD